jgi:hypothetical protein
MKTMNTTTNTNKNHRLLFSLLFFLFIGFASAQTNSGTKTETNNVQSLDYVFQDPNCPKCKLALAITAQDIKNIEEKILVYEREHGITDRKGKQYLINLKYEVYGVQEKEETKTK